MKWIKLEDKMPPSCYYYDQENDEEEEYDYIILLFCEKSGDKLIGQYYEYPARIEERKSSGLRNKKTEIIEHEAYSQVNAICYAGKHCGEYGFDINDFTHWMPWPELPKEKK